MNTKEHTTPLGEQQQQKYVDRDKALEELAHTLTPRLTGLTPGTIVTSYTRH